MLNAAIFRHPIYLVATVLCSLLTVPALPRHGWADDPAASTPSAVVVEVNGTPITERQLLDKINERPAPGAKTTETPDVTALRALVTETLQIQYAQKRGVMPTDDMVDAAVKSALVVFVFQRQLRDDNESVEEYTRLVRVNLAKAAVVTEGIQVTPAEIHTYYQRNIRHDDPRARFYMPATITLQVIRNHSKTKITKADHELRNGHDFADVALEYSTDESKKNQGVSPALVQGRNNMRQVPGMEAAIFKIDIGQRLGPHKFAGDWWIMKCIDKTPPTTTPFDRARIEAEIGAKMDKVTPARIRAIQKDFDLFQKNAKIDVIDDEYKDAITIK